MGRGSYNGGSTVIGPRTCWRESDRTVISVQSKPRPSGSRDMTPEEIDRLLLERAVKQAALGEMREARRQKFVEMRALAEAEAKKRKPATPPDPGKTAARQRKQARAEAETVEKAERITAAAAKVGETGIEIRRKQKVLAVAIELRSPRKKTIHKT